MYLSRISFDFHALRSHRVFQNALIQIDSLSLFEWVSLLHLILPCTLWLSLNKPINTSGSSVSKITSIVIGSIASAHGGKVLPGKGVGWLVELDG